MSEASEKTQSQEIDALRQEIEALRNHNAQLLTEVKAGKQKMADMSERIEQITQDLDNRDAELRSIHLQPAREFAESISCYGPVFLSAFKDIGYSFDLEGKDIVVRDNDGNIMMTGEGRNRRPVGLDKYEIIQLLESTPSEINWDKILRGSQASGGGAGPSSNLAVRTAPAAKPAERLPTGLR